MNETLEEALSKLNNYSDMARALSQHSLASSVRVSDSVKLAMILLGWIHYPIFITFYYWFKING